MNDHPTTRRRLGMALALVAAGLVGGLGATAATAAFNDVPNEGQFAEHITNLQEAGIATGFPDGSFRPGESINRRQTAAWIDRSMPRVALDMLGRGRSSAVLDQTTPSATIAEITVASPAAAIGSGWATIQGAVGGVGDGDMSCPCIVRASVVDENDRVVARTVVSLDADPYGQDVTISPVLGVTPIDGGQERTFRLRVELVNPEHSVQVGGVLFGTYAPMAFGELVELPESAAADRAEAPLP